MIDARLQETANHVGSLQLAHSLAHALPPPGYNRQRPYCIVLTLASGAVYFFQAGTEELVNEWVQTCNYWAARQSKEPLAGGVSNMEYGWNRVSEVLQHGRSMSDDESIRVRDFTDTASVRSGRSNRSIFGRNKDGPATMRVGNSPWSERINISEWKPPLAPSVSSTLDEEMQLEALKKHVAALKQELQEHNELRGPMMALVRCFSSPLPPLFTGELSDAALQFSFSTPRAPRLRQGRSVIGRRSRSICLPSTSSTSRTSIRCRRPWRCGSRSAERKHLNTRYVPTPPEAPARPSTRAARTRRPSPRAKNHRLSLSDRHCLRACAIAESLRRRTQMGAIPSIIHSI